MENQVSEAQAEAYLRELDRNRHGTFVDARDSEDGRYEWRWPVITLTARTCLELRERIFHCYTIDQVEDVDAQVRIWRAQDDAAEAK